MFRERNIGRIDTGEDEISVDHLYDSEPAACPGCGGRCVAPGLVALTVTDESVLLTPEEALLLANRLTRAANLVLETMEDAPDAEREAARFGAVPDYPPDS